MRASQLGKHLARGVKQACLGAQGESISKLRMPIAGWIHKVWMVRRRIPWITMWRQWSGAITWECMSDMSYMYGMLRKSMDSGPSDHSPRGCDRRGWMMRRLFINHLSQIAARSVTAGHWNKGMFELDLSLPLRKLTDMADWKIHHDCAFVLFLRHWGVSMSYWPKNLYWF